jgi:uncharacterized membrane protein YdbT with pleckstrin-like domain
VTFPKKLLTSGEVVVHEVRPHWKALVGPAFWTLLVAVATGFLFVKANGSHRGPIRLAIVGAAFVVWWVIGGLTILRWWFTEYVLTNERLIARTGVIAKRAKDIPLETINDITFHQTILDRLLGSGDLILESAGEHGQEVFDDIPHPADMQKEIYAAAEQRRIGVHGGGGGVSVADELAKLADLRDRGILTPEEFETRKRRLLES